MRLFVACVALWLSTVSFATAVTTFEPRIIHGDGFDVSSPVALDRSRAEYELNWNFAVSYGTYEQYSDGLYFASQCGASYLGHGWFLTAAHCIDSTQFNSDGVAVGSFRKFERSVFDVEEVRVHPLYDVGSIAFDLALIRIRSDLISTLNTYTSPVDLPTVNKAVSTDFRLAGWGATSPSFSNPQPADSLQRARLALQQDNDCAQVYGPTYDPAVMICALGNQPNPQDSCYGDSGGGLIAYEPLANGKLGRMLEGVVSFGAVCGQQASVYARADDFWLNEVYHFDVPTPESVGLNISAYLPTTSDPVNTVGTLTIRNNTAQSIQLGNLQSLGHFVVNGTCTSVPANGRCTVQVSNPTTGSLRGGVLFYVDGKRVFYPLYQRVKSSLAPNDANFFVYDETNWQYDSVTASLTAAPSTGNVVFDVKNEGFYGAGVGFLELDLNLDIADGFDTLSIDADGLGGRVELTGQCTERLAFKVAPGDTVSVFYSAASGRRGNVVELNNLTVVPATTLTNVLRSGCVVKQDFSTTGGASGGSGGVTKTGSAGTYALAGLLLLLGVGRRSKNVSRSSAS
ncbi:serine protease [Salinibius halmophilus]|uniref:serine protease n=1 Tax=Salinibius halmophilus TaxID=1853216 RepID=UPI001313F5BC|nr:serine protease [Salinibius halmophilus]